MAGLDNKIRTDGLTTPFPKAVPVIMTTDEERDVWMRMRRRRCSGRYRMLSSKIVMRGADKGGSMRAPRDPDKQQPGSSATSTTIVRTTQGDKSLIRDLKSPTQRSPEPNFDITISMREICRVLAAQSSASTAWSRSMAA